MSFSHPTFVMVLFQKKSIYILCENFRVGGRWLGMEKFIVLFIKIFYLFIIYLCEHLFTFYIYNMMPKLSKENFAQRAINIFLQSKITLNICLLLNKFVPEKKRPKNYLKVQGLVLKNVQQRLNLGSFPLEGQGGGGIFQ